MVCIVIIQPQKQIVNGFASGGYETQMVYLIQLLGANVILKRMCSAWVRYSNCLPHHLVFSWSQNKSYDYEIESSNTCAGTRCAGGFSP